MDNKLALVAVGYNRVNSLQRLLASLEKADYLGDKIELYISLDKAKTNEVVDFANSFNWSHGEKHVLTYPERLGLRKHILKCGDLLEKYDAIAMLEDDVVVSDGFYNYMKQAVEFYKDCDKVAGISLYSNRWNEFACAPFAPMHSEYDTYFFQFAESRGQIWLKKQWHSFINWYQRENDKPFFEDYLPAPMCRWPESSWKKYHVKYCVDNNLYFAYPYVSFATCFSECGTHTRRMDTFIQVDLYQGSSKNLTFPRVTDEKAVFYDVFYERLNLRGFEDCELDLYGLKGLKCSKKYLISSKILPFLIVEKYGVQMKPQEANLLMAVKGNEFFKYDLSIRSSNKIKTNELVLFRYRFDIYDHARDMLACVFDSLLQYFKNLVKRL